LNPSSPARDFFTCKTSADARVAPGLRLPAPAQLLVFAAMKKLCVVLLGLVLCAAVPTMAADAPAKGKVVHIVAFKYKKAITDAKKKEIANALVALKGKIPQVVSLQHGLNISKEGFDKGFHEAFVLTFASEKDRDIYLEHDEHKKFAKLLDGILADKGVFVFDFVASE
jgi:hypothetical protein